jgi:hypothetical protein
MTRTVVGPYVVSEDVRLHYRAVAVGRVASTVSGMPVPAGLEVRSPRPDVRAVVRDADFCLAADPALAFPAAATVDIVIAADGFAAATATVAIDPAALPTTIGTLELRPLPVRIQGRVVDATRTPLASTRVHTIDDPTVGTTPSTHTLALGRPLARSHPDSAAVQEVVVSGTAPVGPTAAAAGAGSSQLALASRTGLAAGAVLGLGPLASDYAELARVVDPGPAPLSAGGTVMLHDPLTQTVAAGTPVDVLTFAAPSTGTTLAEAAGAGSAIITTNDLVSGLVRVEPGPDEEYRFVGVLTDDAGYYRLDGVGDVLSLWLAAEASGLHGHQAVTVRYGTPVTVVDLQLTP